MAARRHPATIFEGFAEVVRDRRDAVKDRRCGLRAMTTGTEARPWQGVVVIASGIA
jgi:hypothetical protein